VTHHRVSGITDSQVVPYLNRLNDLLFMLARAAEYDWTPIREGESE
jgi:cob(I)alamin adenosyltransferase